MRTVFFEKQAFEDIKHWSSADQKTLKKIIELIADCQKHPHHGLGKPEPLKHQLKGFWSRRISDEHRLVYSANDQTVFCCLLSLSL
ncbi:MAG TPA: Txe/YoeB family addiction module toxin [Bacteroidia bacterium]|nr:Txe/YoeB family addiction module toxin [Bacteroidia bacterium]